MITKKLLLSCLLNNVAFGFTGVTYVWCVGKDGQPRSSRDCLSFDVSKVKTMLEELSWQQNVKVTDDAYIGVPMKGIARFFYQEYDELRKKEQDLIRKMSTDKELVSTLENKINEIEELKKATVYFFANYIASELKNNIEKWQYAEAECPKDFTYKPGDRCYARASAT